MNSNLLKAILQKDQTVFSFKELLLQSGLSKDSLKSQLNYYTKQGDLYHIRRGLYAKNSQYDRLELATKIYIPSYISFETILVREGLIFQYYEQVFVATYQSRELLCDGQSYYFHQLKNSILMNSAGVEQGARYSSATAERAFLDTVYIHSRYHFDNLEPLDWDKVYELLPLYGTNASLKKRVDEYCTAERE